MHSAWDFCESRICLMLFVCTMNFTSKCSKCGKCSCCPFNANLQKVCVQINEIFIKSIFVFKCLFYLPIHRQREKFSLNIGNPYINGFSTYLCSKNNQNIKECHVIRIGKIFLRFPFILLNFLFFHIFSRDKSEVEFQPKEILISLQQNSSFFFLYVYFLI